MPKNCHSRVTPTEAQVIEGQDASDCITCPLTQALATDPHLLADLQRLISENRAERRQWAALLDDRHQRVG